MRILIINTNEDFNVTQQTATTQSFISTLRKGRPDIRWVVILPDPSDGTWSPWNVVAPDEVRAVKQAQKDWLKWLGMHPYRDRPEAPDPLKIYRDSWIGERVDRNNC